MAQQETTTSPGQNVPNELIAQAIQDVVVNDRERDRVVAEGRNIKKRYKALGVDLDALGVTTKNKRRDLDEVIRTFRNTIHYMGVAGQVVSRDSLFDGWTTTLSQKAKVGQDIWDAEDAGYTAGRHGVDIAECPYHPPGSELAAAWLTFHKKGIVAAEQAKGPGVTVVTAPRTRRQKQPSLPVIPPAPPRRGKGKGKGGPPGKGGRRARSNGAANGEHATSSSAD